MSGRKGPLQKKGLNLISTGVLWRLLKKIIKNNSSGQIVESEKVSDEYADNLSFQISQKIQDEMQYPGQIKVTVIREKRAVSFAR